jgi:BirA family biotin operon repressor/biotin-[acetyl-CoA-carboxylase] ligase
LGLNVNNDPTPAQPQAVSLRQLLGRSVPRREVLIDLLERIEPALQPEALDHVLDQWRALSVTLGQRVCVTAGTDTLVGQALDVDEYGALLIRLEDGATRRVIYGDCSTPNPSEER